MSASSSLDRRSPLRPPLGVVSLLRSIRAAVVRRNVIECSLNRLEACSKWVGATVGQVVALSSVLETVSRIGTTKFSDGELTSIALHLTDNELVYCVESERDAMLKLVAVFTSLAVVSTPALTQVAPENCRPVFPLTEELAQVQGDVVADRALPTTETRRRFIGLPLLPLLLAGAGGLVAIGAGGDDDNIEPVSS